MTQHRYDLDPNALGPDEDWEGNNAAFTCPVCGKVFIVSDATIIHNGKRRCPNPTCGKSEAVIRGGRKSGGSASITWPV